MQTAWACIQYLIVSYTAFVDLCVHNVWLQTSLEKGVFRWASSPKLLTHRQSYKEFADEAHGGYNWSNMSGGTDFFFPLVQQYL